MEIDSLWHSAFGETSSRPVLYSSEELNDEGWRPLTDPQAFILNLAKLDHQQLFAASSNNQIAMKVAQDEYLEIETQIAAIRGRPSQRHLQTLPAPDEFQERQEAALYGYKYDGHRPALLHAGIPGLRSADDLSDREKQDVRLFQEPFEQGGFVPKEREYKAMLAKARDPNNIDGWEPVVDSTGRRLIPRQQVHHDEYNITYVKRNVDANGEIARPVSPEGSDAHQGETPDKAVNKRLTRTRFDGKKVPTTRDVSEDPSAASTPRGRKRGSPSGGDSREDTPGSKRQKVGPPIDGQEQPRPKHPNQYTKAKERAAKDQEATVAGTPAPEAPTKAATSSKVHWRDLSSEDKYDHSWTNAELHEAVREDHLWLNPDPVKAEHWKNKLLQNENPIRSFAMFKKWRFWKLKGLDKRPRNKELLSADGTTNKENEGISRSQKPRRRTAKPKNASAMSTPADTPPATPTPTPAPEIPRDRETAERAATPSAKTQGTKFPGSKRMDSAIPQRRGSPEEIENANGNAEADQTSSESRSPKKAPGPLTGKRTGEAISAPGRELRRPSLKQQGSDSTVVVASGTTAMTSSNGTPPRRSLRIRKPSP
ncbi:hypothetical protein A1O7_08062 [Cladophialophora yegresii CBS 114405]|uniref:Uncharacterized protein n=1 Tax=Cladophialophora yegresii CBS 114405 TaxID=1182544 RepID=W9VHL0_9EURO|nr:uncharacterized protein A1O7_08062 [Cladophialophora yegresii CBS 114405]EXJ55137.1 hypothetical protein A1O7_08062 [Cladophialophora yegresii CBS 114405]